MEEVKRSLTKHPLNFISGFVRLTPSGLVVNWCWSSDVIWCHTFLSTFVEVMAWYHHNLNQCLLINSEVLWHSPQGNSIKNSQDINHSDISHNHTFEYTATSSRDQWVKSSPPGQNGHHFADDIFRCIFVNVKFWVLITISLKFVPKGPIDNNPALV